MVGIIPAFIGEIFRPGEVGIVSRSGSLGTLACLYVARAGLGQSAFIGVGGDPIVGTTMQEVCAMLEKDERTRAVVLAGEIGGSQEEDAAEYVGSMRKPVVAMVVGREAPPGKRMGHAGAIVLGKRGSAESKIEALRAAGARVVEFPWEVGRAVLEAVRH
jgi:succinyl-CoA synthetase alpha subunit